MVGLLTGLTNRLVFEMDEVSVDDLAESDWEKMRTEVGSFHENDPNWEKNDLIWEELPDRQSWYDSL